MFTHRALCADVIRFGGQYILIAKQNQPSLWQNLFTFFTDPQAEAGKWEEDHSWHKGHGRLEERRLRTTTLLNPLFAQQWPGIGQAFQLQLDWLHVSNVASHMRRFCARPHEALSLLLGPLQRYDRTLKQPCASAQGA